eukprot:1105314-Heterocapsa_arctica.AAC.1
MAAHLPRLQSRQTYTITIDRSTTTTTIWVNGEDGCPFAAVAACRHTSSRRRRRCGWVPDRLCRQRAVIG